MGFGSDRTGHSDHVYVRRNVMRSLLVMLGIIALVLIVLGLVLKAVKWLIIIGLVALAVSIVMGWLNGRRSVR
jgi:putative flippase GtrA